MEDNQLIISCRKGNNHSFRLLVERYKNYVFTIVCAIVKDFHVAEEVAQDVFLKVYKQLDKFSGQSKFSTWLYRIAVNTALNKVKKKVRDIKEVTEVSEHEISTLDDGFNLLVKADQKDEIKKAIAQLNEIDSLIITLFYLQDCDVKEVSQTVDLSISNTKVRLHRARKKLKELLPTSIKN